VTTDVSITCADCSACFVGSWDDAMRFALDHYRVIIDIGPVADEATVGVPGGRCEWGEVTE
jgi:hypothetical protein